MRGHRRPVNGGSLTDNDARASVKAGLVRLLALVDPRAAEDEEEYDDTEGSESVERFFHGFLSRNKLFVTVA
jgi:hypothetical protein